MTRILVIDDEIPIQRFLKPALTAAGYDVVIAGTAREALRLAATSAPDLIVLDLGLPDRDGKEVLADVRAFSAVPIIILSARDREQEKIAALDLGADDYVEKPFAIGELMARVRTALRHSARGRVEPQKFQYGGLVVDLDRRLVTREGAALKLTPKEYDLLALLVHHAGRVITHRQILTTVWGPAHVDDAQYLRVLISQLRGKIESDPADPKLLLTEPGVGYRLWSGED
jgi:two-component system KDP operon response regulator KdpE